LQDRIGQLAQTVDGIDIEAVRRNLLIMSRNLQKPSVDFPDFGDRDGRNGRTAGQDVVLGLVAKFRPELVIIDNFATAAEVADENDAAAMGPVLSLLLRLKQRRVACILVHHSGKTGETYRGSSKLATTFEVIMGLKRPDNVSMTDGAAFTVVWSKFRGRPTAATVERMVRLVETERGPQWVAEAAEGDDARRLVETVLACRFASQKEVAEHLGWDAAKVSRLKVKAMQAGLVTKTAWDTAMQEAAMATLEAAF
jgi:hypothetical protein